VVQSCNVYDSSLLLSSDTGIDSGAPDAKIDSSIDANVDTSIDANLDAQTDSNVGQDTLASDSPVENDSTIPDAQDPRYCDPCKDLSLIRPPCPPLSQDATSLPGPLIFASRTIRMGADPDKKDDWRTLGFDQDCMATNSAGQPLSCKRPASANLTEDGEGGKDNSFGKNFGGQLGTLVKYGVLDISPENDGNQRFEAGLNGVLFAIGDFNGTANDPSVTVSFYMSGGTMDPATGEHLDAKWDGADIWTIDADSVSSNGKALYADDSAYVTDNTLVSNLPNGLLLKVQGASSTMTLQLNEPRIIGTFAPDHKSFSEITLSGVWQVESALSSLDSYAQEKGICPGTFQYTLAHEITRTSADIRLDLNPAPAKDCNAISLAMTFSAYQAKLGIVKVHKIPGTSVCADAGSTSDAGTKTDASIEVDASLKDAAADTSGADTSMDASNQ